MKKFVTFSSQQENFSKFEYEAVDNFKLKYGLTAYPIVPVINGYLEKEEEFEILVIVADCEATRRNCEVLKEELRDLFKEKNIEYNEQKQLKVIDIPFDDGIDAQLELFGKLVKELNDWDEIYACITYGSKPAEIVELMMLRYIRQIKKNAYIGCVVYGQVKWREKLARIYDVTALVHLDDIIQIAGIEEGEDLINNFITLN